MIEAGAPSTGGRVVPAPPGVVMVAPLEVPRNAESVRSERPRWKWGSKSAAKGIIEAGAFGLRPEGGWARAFYSASSPIRWAFWRLARKFSGSWNATACESSQQILATDATSVSTIVDRNPA